MTICKFVQDQLRDDSQNTEQSQQKVRSSAMAVEKQAIGGAVTSAVSVTDPLDLSSPRRPFSDGLNGPKGRPGVGWPLRPWP